MEIDAPDEDTAVEGENSNPKIKNSVYQDMAMKLSKSKINIDFIMSAN